MDHLEGVQKNLEKGEAVEEGEGGRKESTWLKAPSKHVWNRDSLSLAMCNTYILLASQSFDKTSLEIIEEELDGGWQAILPRVIALSLQVVPTTTQVRRWGCNQKVKQIRRKDRQAYMLSPANFPFCWSGCWPCWCDISSSWPLCRSSGSRWFEWLWGKKELRLTFPSVSTTWYSKVIQVKMRKHMDGRCLN